jgi:subtilisin-like proprotein convertase family protein
MEADYAVWVQDAISATLLQWDGADWVTARALTETAYLFHPGLNRGQTDLYLPFDWLGIGDPATATLDLVAFASEKDALSLWAAMPNANPVSSPLVTLGAEEAEDTVFALTQRYHWDSLGAGLCPNGSQGTGVEPSLDVDLEMGVSANPAGTTYAFLADNLFALWDILFGGRPADVSTLFASRDNDFPLLEDLQEVTYTVHYENLGSDPAGGVTARVRSAYALTLPDGVPLPPPEHGYSQTVVIGTVAPGEAGSVSFRGQVDLSWAQPAYLDCLTTHPNDPEVCEVYLGWAAASVEIYDDAHPSGTPLEWLWADHQVDYRPPQFYGIVWPEYLLAAVTNTLSGYAYEPSGVPQVDVDIQAPAGSTTLNCPDGTPDDGTWSCSFDATAANGGVTPSDGDTFLLRLRATDGTGQVGDWTDWRPFLVDTEPPTLTVSVEARRDLTGTVGLVWYMLSGEIFDNYGAAGVEVCLEEACGPAETALEPEPAWEFEDWPDPAIAIDAGVACGSGAIVRTFVVTESFGLGEVRLAFNGEHGQRDQVRVELTSPGGTTVRVLGDDGVLGTQFQHLDVLLYDAALAGLHEGMADDDPQGPFFDREARPYAPLASFIGEDSVGTWTLTICDSEPAQDDGVYHLSRLVLKPLDTAPHSGAWWVGLPFPDGVDGITQTLSLYGLDLVGNRSDPPLVLTFRLDDVPPVITVTEALASLSYASSHEPTPVLTGTVYDGGGVRWMYATVQDPEGELSRERVGWTGDDWFFPLKPALTGRYLIWVVAEDEAGNGTSVGPYAVDVLGLVKIYLPLVAKQATESLPVITSIYLPLVIKDWSPVVVEEPIVGLTVDSSSPTVLGETTAFTTTIVAGSDISYAWDFGDGTTGSGDSATHIYTSTGVYVAVVTASNSVSQETVTTTVRVVADEEPIAGLTAANSSPTILGFVTSLTATVSAGSHVSYRWDLGDGTSFIDMPLEIDSESIVYYAYGAAGVYTATVTANNSVSVLTATTRVTVTEGGN